MAEPIALTARDAAMRWSGIRDEEAVWGDLRPEMLRMVRSVLEAAMEHEIQLAVGALHYQRSRDRRDYRNGHYPRALVTELGVIEELAIPRTRAVAYQPSFLQRAARRTGAVDRVLRQAFLRGLSTRETAALAETLTGQSLSPASISRLTQRIDTEVAAFHRRRLGFPACYLLLDGFWVSVKTSTSARRRVILAAYAIADDGRRELLDYRQAASESAVEWRRLIDGLLARGIAGDALRLVVHDGAGGIAAALDEALPEVPQQRCWTHRIRNLLEALPRAERPACLRGLRAMYRAPDRRAAVRAYWRWASTWRARHPRLVAGLERDLDALLAVFALPAPVRMSLRSTNLIERAFRELRRRVRPIGPLADRRSADRILYGQVVRLNGLLARRPLAAFTQES